MTRANILQAAEQCVCGHREQDYGSPENNFRLIAQFWESYIQKSAYQTERMLPYSRRMWL